MNPQPARKDLIVLAADKSMKLTIEKLLARSSHLGFRQVYADVVSHPENDPGVMNRCHDFLRSFTRQYEHAIAMCDRDGSGSESAREDLETRIERHLRTNGWDDRASAVVIDPELDVWVWGDWHVLVKWTGWSGDAESLRAWLTDQNLLDAGNAKPRDPKQTLKRVLRRTQKPWSSARFEAMAAEAETSRCTDPAFVKPRYVLQTWFPPLR
jgi:hypothetical protein